MEKTETKSAKEVEQLPVYIHGRTGPVEKGAVSSFLFQDTRFVEVERWSKAALIYEGNSSHVRDEEEYLKLTTQIQEKEELKKVQVVHSLVELLRGPDAATLMKFPKIGKGEWRPDMTDNVLAEHRHGGDLGDLGDEEALCFNHLEVQTFLRGSKVHMWTKRYEVHLNNR